MIVLIALAIAVGYVGAFVGITPVEMTTIVSVLALGAEYARRLCLRWLIRRRSS